MTIITAPLHTQQYAPVITSDVKARTESSSVAEPMDSASIALLVNSLTAELVRNNAGTGKQNADLPVDLRPPALTIGEAAATLSSIIGKLPVLLAALLGSQDALQHEAGAEQRATEGAAVTSQMRTADVLARPEVREPATGVDADATDRSANVGGWLVSSEASFLLTLLRQLLLKFEMMERENGSNMIIMQLAAVIEAGNRSVERAKENLTGAISAAVVTGAVGGAAIHQSFQSTRIQTNSNVGNLNSANKSDLAVNNARHGTKANPVASAELRGARNLDGRPVPKTDAVQDAADLQADATAGNSAMRLNANESSARSNAAAYQAAHSERMAQSQIPASRAMFLNMLAPAVGGTVTAGVQIEAEFTEAERQLLLNLAETVKRIADGHQDQMAKTREMREAASQLVESLQSLAERTSSQIISNYA
jgi:hypothetical protein